MKSIITATIHGMDGGILLVQYILTTAICRIFRISIVLFTVTLNLYIKNVPNLNLYGYIHENNQLLLALLPFVFKDKKQITEHETYQIDPYTYHIETEFFYSASMTALRRTIYFLTHKRGPIDPLVIHYYDRSNNGSDIISIQLNTPYFLHYLYQNYYYNKALDYGKHDHPQHAFLREQLRWIGKESHLQNGCSYE